MSHFSPKPFVLALSLGAFAIAAFAQDAPPSPVAAPAPMQAPAPIVRQSVPPPPQQPRYPYGPDSPYAQPGYQNRHSAPMRQPQVAVTSPAQGIWVRSAPGTSVKTVATTKDSVELRVDKGLVNVTLRQPKENEQILVDMPGGQVALVKDGMYTFNAATNTFRVLAGEAAAFPAADAKAKALTVKEDHAVVFGAGSLKSVEFAPFQAHADILPAGPEGRGREPGYDRYDRGYGYGFYGPAYAYGPYGDGFYGGPYAWGYPYGAWGWDGWGYPYGFGVGIGFGGWWGGGFRGGFRR